MLKVTDGTQIIILSCSALLTISRGQTRPLSVDSGDQPAILIQKTERFYQKPRLVYWSLIITLFSEPSLLCMQCQGESDSPAELVVSTPPHPLHLCNYLIRLPSLLISVVCYSFCHLFIILLGSADSFYSQYIYTTNKFCTEDDFLDHLIVVMGKWHCMCVIRLHFFLPT